MLGKPPDTVPSMLKVKSEGFQDCSMKRKIISSEHTLEKPAKRIKLAPLPSVEGEMKVGDYVRVTQVCQMQYENARGKLIEYLPNKGKWRVDLFDFSKILRIKTHNLRKIDEIRLMPPSNYKILSNVTRELVLNYDGKPHARIRPKEGCTISSVIQKQDGIVEINIPNETITLLPGLLSSAQCKALIRIANDVGEKDSWDETFKSERSKFNVEEISRRMMRRFPEKYIRYRELMNIAKINIENKLGLHLDFHDEDFYIIRYRFNDREGRFKHSWHTDCDDEPGFQPMIILLNEDFQGGGTGYKSESVRVSIQPLRAGTALLHSHKIFHGGLPITEGTRYIAVAFPKLLIPQSPPRLSFLPPRDDMIVE